MNPLNDPVIFYLRAMLGARIHALRTEDRSRGASALEWAIISGILVIIALAVYATIRGRVQKAQTDINKDTPAF
ncbi:hypothetical protein DPM19_25915 [Actinomadura craniellae]|uniref:Uncharacterized protein n=1 Tax=Actinomadura craniellae TaxID=2231787 RepID=A0A365H1T2_9ACTN|nr:hypothetical protein [Actinomadura craniellae]RAY12163.1 hypothetical protein DPM19_25915 [Actinomadura craniellae]